MCVCAWVSKCMCFSLRIHPDYMARRQRQADNILKETLQYCILNSNYSNVYSNQHHNRWRGTHLWQASRLAGLAFHGAVVSDAL